MFVRRRLPKPPYPINWGAKVGIGVTLIVLYLGVFVLDPTPHVPPHWSIGLTSASLVALAAQVSALIVWHRDQAATRRREAARLSRLDVAYDTALPLARHRATAAAHDSARHA